jgi:anti-sigma regulatory factor (Ser/Thr protein kinase)
MASHLTIAADAARLSEARRFVEELANRFGFPEDARYQMTVASNEAVSNAIEHGEPCCCDGEGIHLWAEPEQDELAIYVRDCGDFVLEVVPTPDPIADRGRGFTFMSLLMDDVSLDTKGGGTVVRLAKRLPEARDSLVA